MSMRRLNIAILLAGAMSMIPVYGHAFNLSQMLGGSEEQDLKAFKLIHVADLKAMMAKGGDRLHVYDANIDATRERFGIIPGATLLASYDNYPVSVLPRNKHAKLVFYCADTH